MKSFKVLLIITAAASLVACSQDDANNNISYDDVIAAIPTPIEFGTYIGETPVTRAGVNHGHSINTNEALQTASFGVFGYYNAGDGNADGAYNSSSTPNFMWNQKVTYTSGWSYTPLKYWPNEAAKNTAVDGTATTTSGTDKLSFFAYAPYVKPANDGTFTPAETSGITGLSGNDAEGDPKVSYIVATDPSETVDLLWAVAAADQTTATVSGDSWSSVKAGMPFIDLVKPKLSGTPATSTPINFSFKHALAKLAFTVQGTENGDENTRIVIESVNITSKFHTSGSLNLHNTEPNKPNWTHAGTPDLTLGVTDKIVAGSADATGLKYSGTDSYASQPLGVTNAAQPLMDESNYYFALIPETADMTIDITYHVYTDDSKLSTGFSKVTNKISSTISGLALEASKSYTINMVLGMESVSFNGTVAEWDTTVTQAVNLPLNVTTP